MLDRLYVDLADGDLKLVKLVEAHRAALRDVCAADADIWAIYSSSFGPDHFDQSFDELIGRTGRMPYAVFDGDTLVGMTAWLRPDVSAQTVEIGNSYIHPDARGTGFNRRLKNLMLDHAFAVGIRRIEFRIDERNARSQAAVAKLGAVKEGVLRAERVTWTGYVRSTGLFGLLADEWAARP
ncbi:MULTISPECIES: GNAT family protein [unclassified Sphingopyxis]|jgi:RimJ/RimL family protein N-acetyltransferase|uniref:GNAT family N-acetyltransferase n=1 Tax=unclassified Sphingopyxis TaxID=2614943 RepID=UPI0028580E85|nr:MULTISPECIES: GNAT family protein [unclassified Sphingopyxis]MDR6834260.1 RimJ/RimL family protein N-acetyltransferase [Sphingopyxis sp. BE122]MDR7226529.1 RimJ/RimL family protein N-acetyltransferase [Sphingopyxis sp. BE259]